MSGSSEENEVKVEEPVMKKTKIEPTPSDVGLGKSVLQPCSESKEKLKKHKEKKQKVVILSPTEKKMKKEKKKKKKEKESCCFGCKEAKGNNEATIYVKGFERLSPRDEIKNELSNIFGSCGEIQRVFVPMECGTLVPLGFAFINLINRDDNKKALELNGSYMEGRKLEVKMATKSEEYYGFPDFDGCDRCLKATARLIFSPRPVRRRWRFIPITETDTTLPLAWPSQQPQL